MNPQPNPEDVTETPLYEPDTEATYQLEVVEKITGVSSRTILHYQENGLIRASGSREFDGEALRTLRLIEHLRSTCEANVSGLKLILELMDEVERLREELRSTRNP